MKILIAGASGFIGQRLVAALTPCHSVTVLGRDQVLLQKVFVAAINTVSWDNLPDLNAADFDVVINLCGHNIAASRWNARVKKHIIDSRVKTSAILIDWIVHQKSKPRFICANAVGIYGMQDDKDTRVFDEYSPIDCAHPHDFMSEIGVQWQQALQPAIDYGLSVTTTRFGVVLEKGQGVLKKMVPAFYWGLGAVLGNGKQTMSWVHIDDVVGAFLFLLDRPDLTGAFNVTSPNPVSQAEFARTLAAVMHRPLLLTMPAAFIRMLFGEMGECLLLKGQRVVPTRLTESGYAFVYPELIQALQHEFP